MGMLLDGATAPEAARVLGHSASDVRHVVQRSLSKLRQGAPVVG